VQEAIPRHGMSSVFAVVPRDSARCVVATVLADIPRSARFRLKATGEYGVLMMKPHALKITVGIAILKDPARSASAVLIKPFDNNFSTLIYFYIYYHF
jgi:hypothetical protein